MSTDSRDTLGVRSEGRVPHFAYQHETEALRSLLRAGGIDTRDAAHRPRALAVLRGANPSEETLRLARHVGAQHSMDSHAVEALAGRIGELFQQPRPDLAVRRLLRELTRVSTA